MCELAQARPRFGYRRVHVLLRRDGWYVNMKRVRRLYRLEGRQLRHRVRRRKYARCTMAFRPQRTARMSGGAWILSMMH
jgi:putative transposase